jgi:hypothetical protein
MRKLAALLTVPLAVFAVSCGEDEVTYEDGRTEVLEYGAYASEWVQEVDPVTQRSFRCLKVILNLDQTSVSVWCYENDGNR